MLCGDSTMPRTVERLMAGERAVLMATDPPYLVDYDGGNHPQTWGKRRHDRRREDQHWDAYTDHDQAVGFYRDFLARRARRGARRAARHLPVVCHDAHGIVAEAWRG